MWNQNTLEILKLVVSVLTPITIAVFGILINRTIQRQNAIAQRQSSWLTKWADDFLKAASGFNESAKKFMWYYVAIEWKKVETVRGFAEGRKPSEEESFLLLLELNKGWVEISMFIGLAPTNGNGFKKAASDLLTEAKSWHDNRKSDISKFLEKQLRFNENARKVHAELLGVKESED